jgi:hypothetical protein
MAGGHWPQVSSPSPLSSLDIKYGSNTSQLNSKSMAGNAETARVHQQNSTRNTIKLLQPTSFPPNPERSTSHNNSGQVKFTPSGCQSHKAQRSMRSCSTVTQFGKLSVLTPSLPPQMQPLSSRVTGYHSVCPVLLILHYFKVLLYPSV